METNLHEFLGEFTHLCGELAQAEPIWRVTLIIGS